MLKEFTKANIDRLPHFINAKGELTNDSTGENWSLTDWCTAVTGELGEAANIIKKIRRGAFSLEEARADLADEFADILTYLVLLSNCAGVDLGQAAISKWNRVSARIGYPVRLEE